MAKHGHLKDENGNILYPISDVYSTKEQIVGVWMDGRDIYRKVLGINPTMGDWEPHNHGITGVNEFLPTSTAILHRKDGQWVPLSFCYPVENRISLYSAGWQITSTTVDLWIGSSMFEELDTINYGVVVVLDYTKK